MDVQILIVDDHATVRESLRFMFAAAGMKQTMEATTCEQAIEMLRVHDIDLVLLDVALRDGQGLDAMRTIRAIDASTAILVHSFQDSPRLLSQCFHAGAAGYVVKGRDKNALIHAVRQAAAGASLWTGEQRMRIREADAETVELDVATAESGITECSTCGRQLRVRTEYLGQRVACGHCGRCFNAIDSASAIPAAPSMLERADEILAKFGERALASGVARPSTRNRG